MEIYELSEKLLELRDDLRAEVVARELLETGNYDAGNLLIVPDGAFRRSSSRDVVSLTEEIRERESFRPFVKIHVSRESLSEMIPPGIVYQPVISREERSAEVMLEDIDISETEFNHARTFFMPFDIEFGRQRIFLENLEHHAVTDTLACFNDDLYDYIWPDIQLDLDPLQKAALLELTIHAHHSNGNLKECAYYMKKVLNQTVNIRTVAENRDIKDVSALKPLGKSLLGVDWVPFEKFTDHECVQIEVGPVADEELVHFRQHEPIGKNYHILEFLCDLLLPVEISWSLVLIPKEGHFRISRKKETGVLGYSTVLG